MDFSSVFALFLSSLLQTPLFPPEEKPVQYLFISLNLSEHFMEPIRQP
tara:strand:- start:214 stop:357 length:144 start_codon:yes stop_codon:yes gene_type:complete